jgi:hypothetical protein
MTQTQTDWAYTGYNTNSNTDDDDHRQSHVNDGTPPGIAWLDGKFHIFFKDHNGRGVMHITSLDGLSGWERPASWYTGQDASEGPSAVAFGGKLHLFYRDATGNGIYHRSSTNGDDWGGVSYFGLDCDGQPKVIATPACIYLVAVDAGGNGIMYAKSEDGENFRHDYTGYNTNGSGYEFPYGIGQVTEPAVAWFNNLFHIFFQDHHGYGVMHITSPDGEGRNWSRPASWYTGANTSTGPEAVVAAGKLHLFHRGIDEIDHKTDFKIHHRSSADGENWSDDVAPNQILSRGPTVGTAIAVDDAVHFTCIDGQGNGIMVARIS